jgi:hypothetical protein
MRINLGIANLETQIKRIAEPAQAVAKQMERWNRIAQGLLQRHQTTTTLLVASGWPPPLNFPASGLDDLLDLFDKGDVSESELGGVFVGFYDEQQLSEMQKRWEANQHIAHRATVLSEGMANYAEGRFASCVSLVLPNLEGVIGDYLNRKPNPKNDVLTLFDASGLDDAAAEFYRNAVLANFDWQNDPILGLNRHQILHGKDVSFGTQTNALKTLLLFDAFQQAVLDKQSGGVHG